MLLVDSVGDFVVQSFTRTEVVDFCIGVEEVEDAACGFLIALTVNVNYPLYATEVLQLCVGLTSPPPITRTFLFFTCQARMSDPPPSTSGYWLCAIML